MAAEGRCSWRRVTGQGHPSLTHCSLPRPSVQAASRTNDLAGDGTTTATILSAAMIAEGMKIVMAGVNPVQVIRGVDKTGEPGSVLLGPVVPSPAIAARRAAPHAAVRPAALAGSPASPSFGAAPGPLLTRPLGPCLLLQWSTWCRSWPPLPSR